MARRRRSRSLAVAGSSAAWRRSPSPRRARCRDRPEECQRRRRKRANGRSLGELLSRREKGGARAVRPLRGSFAGETVQDVVRGAPVVAAPRLAPLRQVLARHPVRDAAVDAHIGRVGRAVLAHVSKGDPRARRRRDLRRCRRDLARRSSVRQVPSHAGVGFEPRSIAKGGRSSCPPQAARAIDDRTREQKMIRDFMGRNLQTPPSAGSSKALLGPDAFPFGERTCRPRERPRSWWSRSSWDRAERSASVAGGAALRDAPRFLRPAHDGGALDLLAPPAPGRAMAVALVSPASRVTAVRKR